MSPIFGKNNLSSTESVDIIEKIVYEYLKPLGFRKHGRTLHRFVDTDISQVVNFQNGCPSKGVYDILWVNIGIRVPECVERKFKIEEPLKKYYHEYECNIRTRLGSLVDGKDTFYDLKKNPNKIGKDIVEHLKKYVEIPLAIKSLSYEEAYQAVTTAAVQNLKNFPAQKLVIVSQADDIGTEILRSNLRFEGDVEALDVMETIFSVPIDYVVDGSLVVFLEHIYIQDIFSYKHLVGYTYNFVFTVFVEQYHVIHI